MSKETKVLRYVCVNILDVQHKWGGDSVKEKAASKALAQASKCVSVAIYIMTRKDKPDEG